MLEKIKKEDVVSIRADKLTPYEEFVFIIDLLKQKNIEMNYLKPLLQKMKI